MALQSVLSGIRPQNPLADLGQRLASNRATNENILASEQAREIKQQSFDKMEQMKQVQLMNSLAKQMINVDESQWPAMLQPYFGDDLSQLSQLDKPQLQGFVAQTDSILGGGGQQGVKVGARKIYSDGTIIQSTPEGPRVFSPSGKLLTGKDAEEQVKNANENEIALAGGKAGAAKTAQIESSERQGIIKQGLAARDMLRDTNKLIELNEAITTGKTAKARKFFGDVFGVTDPDLGQFNALAGKLVLGQIRQLGANPTEGERQFLLELQPSIEQGGAVNTALLADLKEMQNRQVERAKWFSKPENRGKTIAEYFLETDKDDFSPTYNGGAAPPLSDAEYQRRKKKLLGG